MEERCIQCRMKKDVSGLARTAIVERTKAIAQNLKQERFACSVRKSDLTGYKTRQHPDDIAVFVELKRSKRLPLAPRDDCLGCRTFSAVAFLRLASVPNKR